MVSPSVSSPRIPSKSMIVLCLKSTVPPGEDDIRREGALALDQLDIGDSADLKQRFRRVSAVPAVVV